MLTVAQGVFIAVVAAVVGGGVGAVVAARRGQPIWTRPAVRTRLRRWQASSQPRLRVVAGWSRRQWPMLLIGGAVLLLGYSCAVYEPPPPRPPLTVASVRTFVDMTLSDGTQVHDTRLDDVASAVVRDPIDDRDATYLTCQQAQLTAHAQAVLTGRVVTKEEQPMSTYAEVGPLPGYVRLDLQFATPDTSYGDDLSNDFQQARYAAESTCTVPEPAPAYEPGAPASAPSSTSSDGDVDVDVDADHHRDHHGPIERRICRHTWFC